jgi:hypothetical protein
MILVKLTERDDGTLVAESPKGVIGYFDDMELQELKEYLVAKAAQADETVRFVEDFEEREESVSIERLMRAPGRKR